jgi:hypothetical protein
VTVASTDLGIAGTSKIIQPPTDHVQIQQARRFLVTQRVSMSGSAVPANQTSPETRNALLESE